MSTLIVIVRMIIVSGLLLGAGTPDAAAQQSREGAPGWSASSLRIPGKKEPWKFMREVDGNYVVLDIPQGLSMMQAYPPSLRQSVERYVGFRNANIDLLSGLAADTERLLRQHRFHRVPQYDRHLNTAVISIESSQMLKDDPLYRYEPIFMNLPPYARVHVFAPEQIVGRVLKRMKALWHDRQFIVHPVAGWTEQADETESPPYPVPWTQDLFRVALDESDREYLLTPMCYVQSDNLCRWDADYLRALSTKEHSLTVVRIPIFFRAGNILMGESSGKTLFIGRNVLRFNSWNFFNAAHIQPPDESIIALLKATSGADHVSILPNSTDLFHLDMAMTFLEQGVAAVIDPLDKGSVPQADRQALGELAKTLSEMGFKIIRIPTTAKRIKAFQSPVNAVVYVNRTDGQRTILLPEYPDATVYVKGEKRSLNQMIRDAYAATGIAVVPIEDRFHLSHGDVHCVFKVIN